MEFLDNGGKRLFWVVHRRGGKDLTFIHQTAKMAHVRRGVYWHIFPSFAQARKAIWEGFRADGKRILENAFPGFMDPKRAGSIVKRKDEQQMSVEFKNGSIWRLIGSDRIELVGAGPVGVTFSEYALSNPRGWDMIRPMLRENEGWAAFITTPRGRNHAKELYDIAAKDPSWFCELQTLEQTEAWRGWRNEKTGQFFASAQEVKDAECSDGMPDALVKQEYDCDWNASLVGSVWGDLIDSVEKAGGMKGFDHPYENVFTSWDLGFTDATAIWFWVVQDGGIDVIDYYEAHGKPLSHYFDIVDRKPWSYAKHWLPHDSRQTTLAAGVSILNQCLKHWPGKVSVGPDLPLLDGIQAARWVFQQGVRFHPRTKDGIEALRQYHYEYDEDNKRFSARPAHTWASHGADAWRYMAAVVKVSELLTRPRPNEKSRPVAKSMHHNFSLEQLFTDRSQAVAARRRI